MLHGIKSSKEEIVVYKYSFSAETLVIGAYS